MSLTKNSPITVFMYHSIGISNKNWIWNHLTCNYKRFKLQLNFLKIAGFNTVTLDVLFNYIFNNKSIPPKSFVITIDDGYVDNWVFVYPILKELKMKATVFISPEFVDKRDIVRKRLDEINSKKEINELETLGFLSWPEIKEMERSGVIDIQSHALTHTFYSVSDKIIDFRHSNDNYYWITWNENAEKKPYLQIDNQKLINYGEPVYKFDKSLSSPQYFPDKKLKEYLINYCKKAHKEQFFQKSNWRDILFNELNNYKKHNEINGYFESPEEYRKRIRYELSASKNILEEKLSKRIEFLCWPGGGATNTGIEIAESLGFKMSTAALDIQNMRKYIKNCPPQTIRRFKRESPLLLWNNRKGINSKSIYKNGFFLYLTILIYQNKNFVYIIAKAILKISSWMISTYWRIFDKKTIQTFIY